MRCIISFLSIIIFAACTNAPTIYWKSYDETAELQTNQAHENPRMRFELIQSKLLDKNEIWAPFEKALNRFGNDTYQALKPLICLLYTSPSPRDKRQSRMPSSA